MRNVLQIVLVDDHPAVRIAMRAMLDGIEEADVVGEAADGAEALRVVEDTVPDVVLMDVRMPGMDGIEATYEISRRFPDIRVIAVSSFDDTEQIGGMFAAGASGYLVKPSPQQEVRDALRAVAAGRPAVSPEAFGRVLEDLAARYRAQKGRADRLAAADGMRTELLGLLSDGLRNPLTAVGGAATTLRRDWAHIDDTTREALLAQIETQWVRLRQRVDDVIATVAQGRSDGEVLLPDIVEAALARLRPDGFGRVKHEFADVSARGDAAAAIVVVRTVLEQALDVVDGSVDVRIMRDATPVVKISGALRRDGLSAQPDRQQAEGEVARAAVSKIMEQGGGALTVAEEGSRWVCRVVFAEP